MNRNRQKQKTGHLLAQGPVVLMLLSKSEPVFAGSGSEPVVPVHDLD